MSRIYFVPEDSTPATSRREWIARAIAAVAAVDGRDIREVPIDDDAYGVRVRIHVSGLGHFTVYWRETAPEELAKEVAETLAFGPAKLVTA